MNWKFWKKEPAWLVRSMREEMEREEAEVWAEIEAAKKAKAQAEWDALPDHRKAARIEYQYFQKMARKPAPYAGGLGSLAQMAALQNAAMQQFPPSPYMQMNNEIGRAIWLEKGGFL